MLKTNSLKQFQFNPLQSCAIYNATSDVIVLPQAIIAKTDQDKAMGFQYWSKLDPDDAILFLFNNEDIRSMHMRNVAFPLLMVWMGVDHVVKSIVLAEPSETLLYSSMYPAQYCLECHPSLAAMLQIGDLIKFFKF